MKSIKPLRIVEIFYSIQGEGANFGKPAVFVRLAGCNKDCWFCDTDWHQGISMAVQEIVNVVQQYPSRMIIWTGGEPTLQLTDDVLECFDGYYHCIETNGTNKVPSKIDYIACSPKVTEEELRKNFISVDEFRFPIGVGELPPPIEALPPATNYFVSPLFLGEEKKRFEKSEANMQYCIEFVKQNPQWRLSVQMHKLLHVE
ncbi:7-carboxy-7-deazaguanine synthase QueE [Microbacter margulisiae]|uniref:7-carboxy-7-deazaguanine synthase n=1 Tax=Microbacter margulisiae TaxID=1350067 RepID=A0A7W5DQ99_9PORP|nr:7-carboxy-7-deazaguanine synthase QueE [Microbacter margulisiae]MBB3187031.1 organic radical activating enzyme [Microbacter margulisiae]